jgi:hypothetical protein
LKELCSRFYGRLDFAQNRYPVIFSCIEKNGQLNAAEKRVYISTKKFIKAKKWGDWRSRPPKISYCKKMVKILGVVARVPAQGAN